MTGTDGEIIMLMTFYFIPLFLSVIHVNMSAQTHLDSSTSFILSASLPSTV